MKIFNTLFFSETQRGISKRILLFTFLAFVYSFTLFGQAPAGYYDGANGKTGNDLKYSLYLIIKDHTVLSYDQLWTAFQYTDKKSNGKVWDMYSDIPGGTPPYEFTFSSDQCGNYSGESDCYNREHSFPKSWFSDASPMYSDLFHLYPTDGYVNGKRSNWPFGEVSSPSWTSLNGSKVGTCSYPGYSGTVFEPIDEYKGDFARSYFYMVTRYHNVITGWNTDMLDGSQFPAFTSWAKNMLIEWHNQDPVSQKEIDRNNVIYNDYQHNRNPFIDNPDYVDLIWGVGTVNVSFTSNPLTTAQAGVTYTYNITVTGKTGATFTITAPTKPSWLSISSTGNGTATLTGTPTEGNVGNNSVVLNVTDGTSSKDQSFTINVSSSIVPLQFTSTPTTTGQVGIVYNYNVNLTGNSGSTFTISATTKPSWLTLTTTGNGTATLTGTPTAADAGANAVVLTGGDGNSTVEQSFSINVTEANSGTSFIETFENIPADNSSYSNRSWTGDNSINWTATSARTDQTINTRAICFSQSGTPTLESQTLTGGCSQIKFKHQQKFSGSGGTITLLVNNTEIGSADVTSDVQTSTFAVTGFTGDFVIKLVSNGVARIAIDDLEWQKPSTANNLPEITSILINPSNPLTGQTINISANVSDSDGNVQSVVLEWGNSPSALNNSESTSVNGNTYTAEIPSQEQARTIYFKITATDNSSGITTYSNSFDVGTNQIPIISNISRNPTNPTSSQTITITANISDPEGRLALSELNWGTSSNSLTNNIPMTNSASVYSAIIPAQANEQNIYYQIKAKDAENNWAESSVLNFMVSNGTTNQLPSITTVTTSPNAPVTGQAITISSSITDPDGNVVKALLSWGNTSAANSSEMEMNASQNNYNATIPAQSQIGTVYFKISAIDNSEDTSYYNLSVNIGTNQLPVISNISQNPINPTSSDVVGITAQVVDPEGRLGTVLIQWGSASNTLNSQITMTNSSSTLSGSIPAQTTGSNIYYRIKAFDVEGNQTFSDILNYTVSASSGIGDDNLSSIKVYPNPFRETLTVDVDNTGNTTVVIMDIIGKVLHTTEFSEKSQPINTNSLKTGIYIVKVVNGGKTSIIRVVKR